MIIVAILFICAMDWNFQNKNECKINDYCKFAKTGDIILFSSRVPDLRWALGNNWSHIGVVIENEKNKSEPYFVESDIPLTKIELERINHLKNEKVKNGVKMVYLREKLINYKGSIAFRSLKINKKYKLSNYHSKTIVNNKSNPIITKNWIKYIKTLKDIEYENSASFWLKNFLSIRKLLPTALNLKHFKDRKKVFCSELTYDILQHFGILRDHIKSAYLLPQHFSYKSTSLNKNFISENFDYGKEILLKN
jgi:hypothetical protein